NVFVHDLHQLADAVGPFAFRVFQGFEGGTLDDRHFVAGEIIFGEQVPHFHFNQLEQFFVVHHVHLVQEDDDVGNAHLAGKQDVLPGLRHRTVSGGNDEDRSVHLGSPGDHVFHVVGVTRAVHVSIVTIFGFILDVGGGDGDPPLFFFRRLVDLIIGGGNRSAGFGKHGGDRRGQRGFSVVDVTDGADIDVRLGALKF